MKLTQKIALVLVGGGITLGGAFYYYAAMRATLPNDIELSNGRIEAQMMDVATRSGGRVLSVAVEEGDMVNAGDVVATLDLHHLEAALVGAQANVRAALQRQAQATSMIEQARSTMQLADKEAQRSSRLVKKGAISRSVDDHALQQKQSAMAAFTSAQQQYQEATEAVEIARAEVTRQTDLLSDKDVKAVKSGRVLYKLVEAGEVVANGGKLVTLLDLTDVYMTVFFSTDVVGKLRLGDEARVVLDALPNVAIPATISYISPEAQFTPRQVETKNEREKMMFRVKVRIPESLLKKHRDEVKTGLPGVAYVRTQPHASWPSFLMVRPDLAKDAKE